MNNRLIGCVIAAALVAGPAAFAQNSGVEEIVVTASLRDYDAMETPHVALKRRADNLITEVKVVCDTRDLSQRREELKSTLRAMIKAAGPGSGIELGLGDQVVGRFDAGMLDAVIRPDVRADTSFAVVVVKTRVQPTDTFDSAAARITGYIEKTPKTGRTEMLRQGDWNLTLIGPERHRGDIIALIAADGKQTAGAFGDGYGVAVEGLQLPVSWYQSGPLELALYIPYRQRVERR